LGVDGELRYFGTKRMDTGRDIIILLKHIDGELRYFGIKRMDTGRDIIILFKHINSSFN
jgi:hypothetical protein